MKSVQEHLNESYSGIESVFFKKFAKVTPFGSSEITLPTGEKFNTAPKDKFKNDAYAYSYWTDRELFIEHVNKNIDNVEIKVTGKESMYATIYIKGDWETILEGRESITLEQNGISIDSVRVQTLKQGEVTRHDDVAN